MMYTLVQIEAVVHFVYRLYSLSFVSWTCHCDALACVSFEKFIKCRISL